jgi:thioredoxin 2
LLDGTPVALSERNFDAFVRPPGLPVVVDFWAPWCGPCISMAPAFGEAARRLATVARFAKVNTEESSQLAQRFSIRSIPTLVLLRNGQEVKRISGAMDASSLIRWTNEERS